MTRGQNVQLFFADGTLQGLVKGTLANWTGIAYKIPRTDLDKCRTRSDLSQTGVYFLFGASDETDERVVYVGQAGVRKNGEGLLNRLLEHKRNPDKDYWTEAVVFTTSNNSFGPTEISYLENRFCKMATDAGRYTVKNGNDPTPGNITEEKESELETFIDNAMFVMGSLGHNVFDPVVTVTPESITSMQADEPLLYLTRKSGRSGRTLNATGKQTSEGFVLLKGSDVELIDSEKIPPHVKTRRATAPVDANGVLKSDLLVNSPSYGAAFVIGGYANGLAEWKTADGTSLKELESKG